MDNEIQEFNKCLIIHLYFSLYQKQLVTVKSIWNSAFLKTLSIKTGDMLSKGMLIILHLYTNEVFFRILILPVSVSLYLSVSIYCMYLRFIVALKCLLIAIKFMLTHHKLPMELLRIIVMISDVWAWFQFYSHCFIPVSYTHLDVYKRQLLILITVTPVT